MSKNKLPEIRCINCKKLFQPSSTRNNKCSSVCRAQWYKKEEDARNARRSAKLRESWLTHTCLVCEEEFVGPVTRVTCSSKCSRKYVNSGEASRRFKERSKIVFCKKEPVLEEKEIGDECLDFKRDSEITEAIKDYKKKGGTITVLKEEPAQKIPSVDLSWKLGGWDWQALYGAGTYTGVGEYIYAEIQRMKESKNG